MSKPAPSTTPAPAIVEGRYADGIAQFPSHVFELIEKYLNSLPDRSIPVLKFASPDEIKEAFKKAGIPVSLEDDEKAEAPAKLLDALNVVSEYSVRTGSPFFFNQLYARADPVSIAGEMFATALNTNLHTYEVAPVFTVMEHEVLNKLARCIGEEFAKNVDGLFVPGGSIANMYSLELARFRKDPDFKKRGAVGGPRLVSFTSEQSHYSYLKSTILLGIGSDNLVKVKVDGQGRMIPGELEKAIEAAKKDGGVPFHVGATAGTTVLGAFDDFEAIAAICKKHDLWMHIDGAWGASTLLSPKHRHIMKGADLADSLAWNAHKMMGMPLQCSVLLTKHKTILSDCNATKAAYLFQKDKNFTSMDQGDKTMQCGRHIDVLKIWLAWKAYGDAGFAAHVDRAFELAEYMDNKIRNDPDGKFVPAFPRVYTNVTYWYVPPSLRPYNPDTADAETNEKMAKVAVQLKDRMQKTGAAMIGFQPLAGRPNFFRIVFAAAAILTKDDVDTVLRKMDELGQDL